MNEYAYPYRERFSAESNNTNADDSLLAQLKSSSMKIMYATRTRPDVLFTTAILATRKLPRKKDISDSNKLASYLKATKNDSMVFKKSEDIQIPVYCEASFCCHNGMQYLLTTAVPAY